jgi:hypothetical protein
MRPDDFASSFGPHGGVGKPSEGDFPAPPPHRTFDFQPPAFSAHSPPHDAPQDPFAVANKTAFKTRRRRNPLRQRAAEETNLSLVDWRWAASRGFWSTETQSWNPALGGLDGYLKDKAVRRYGTLLRRRKPLPDPSFIDAEEFPIQDSALAASVTRLHPPLQVAAPRANYAPAPMFHTTVTNLQLSSPPSSVTLGGQFGTPPPYSRAAMGVGAAVTAIDLSAAPQSPIFSGYNAPPDIILSRLQTFPPPPSMYVPHFARDMPSSWGGGCEWSTAAYGRLMASKVEAKEAPPTWGELPQLRWG